MEKAQKISNGLITFFAIIILSDFAYNIIARTEGFWESSFIEIIEMLILLVVSYFLVQMQNKVNRRKEKIDFIVSKIQNKILDEELIRVGTENERLVTKVKFMSIANLLECVRDINYKKAEKNIELIISNMDILTDLVLDHINDEKHIINSNAEITRLITSISDRLDRIHLDLE